MTNKYKNIMRKLNAGHGLNDQDFRNCKKLIAKEDLKTLKRKKLIK